ncbi:Uncharacterized protein BP5553_08330 [Venustampulla echinocandica]|uniref:Orc1-like AAA ATPase domain-containing protein n=1 Tax=Venustampulla echinocandica TaxID=2656787 RepID=A0A370TGD9_9HELO|nr:Uncharacterized protein BP5553_08330 [Venustampulla echinocandica]RDL33962.1 Uncharacterized protein BP5553_08330 [Venustampulla echinocandica]
MLLNINVNVHFQIRAAPCRNVVLYGLEATGKSSISKALLGQLSPADETTSDSEDQLRHAIINSTECVSGRHLLEKTVAEVANIVGWQGKIGRCENLAQLVVELGKMLDRWTTLDDHDTGGKRLALVFDGIDRQREAPPTLLPALARLGEIIPNITVIYIVTSPRPNFLHLPGVPHIHFPAYTKPELLQIISLTEPTPQLPTGKHDTKEVWSRFSTAVYESLSKHSDRDIISFRRVCSRLWPRFIQPILDGSLSPTPFSRLLVANRSLFQNDAVLVPSIISSLPTPSTKSNIQTQIQSQAQTQGLTAQLPHTSRLLLLAAYLASFNPPRTDIIHFMKSATLRRKKKGGGTALTSKTPGVSKNRKISRKLLGPQAFVVERMLAIFHYLREDASVPRKQEGRRRDGMERREDVIGSADLYMAIATLSSLRLLVKLGAANAGDALDGSSRYRVAVGWDVVRSLGRSVGVEVEDYLAD